MASVRYPDAIKQVEEWYASVTQADWRSLEDIRQIYPDTDPVGNFTVFNIKGNNYRLIVEIDYEDRTVYFKYFLTHAEYNKDKWKDDFYF